MKGFSSIVATLRGGALACAVPASFDAAISLLRANLSVYSPPYSYLVFFLLGCAFGFISLKKAHVKN